MSLAVVAVGAGVAVAGSAAYSSYSSSNAAKSAANAAVPSKKLIEAAAGRVPDAARYKPVDFGHEQLQAITDNIGATPMAIRLAADADKGITANALTRINALVPGYSAMLGRYGATANDLLNARLPFNDVMGTLGNSNERAGALGTPGAGAPGSLRDLGLSELSGVQAGGSILKDMVGMAEQVSPTNQYVMPQSQFQSPASRIQETMAQNQLIQQSDQNANNLAAAGDPAARLALGLQVSGVTGYHGGDPTLGAINAGIGSLGSSVLGMAGGGKGMSGGGGTASGIMGLFGGAGGGAGGSAPAGGGAGAGASGGYASYGGGYMPTVPYYGGGIGSPGGSLQYYTG